MDLAKGGPSSGPPDFADVGVGSGACLRAPEAFGVFLAKYVFS